MPSQTSSSPSSGNLMRGYSFLADHIYRSVSNPLYKLVQTVEDTMGSVADGGTQSKPIQDETASFQHGGASATASSAYQHQPSGDVKFELGGFEGAKLMGQDQVQPQHAHRQSQGFSGGWDGNAVNNANGTVQHWYPRVSEEMPNANAEAYVNWQNAHSAATREHQKPAAPANETLPEKSTFHQPQQRYSQPNTHQYFQEWADAAASNNQYYHHPQFDITAGTTASSASPQQGEEVAFRQNADSTTTTANGDAACPGCCVPSSQQAPNQQVVAYGEQTGDLNNGLCLVDPMRALPRYLTSGLWPPVINSTKLEWTGHSSTAGTTTGVGEDGNLPEMNRFYGDGSGYRMCGTAAVPGAVYPGYAGIQDTKDFFFSSSRIGGYTAQEVAFRQKAEAHRLSSSVDCDPQELEAFAERFKQRRVKLGVTQADVGKALGRLNLAGVGSFSQSTICRFESLTLSHNNMLALKPILQAWLEEAEQEAAVRQKNPSVYDLEDDDKKRKRTSITDPEKRSLEAFFGIQPRPSSEKIAQIAEKLHLKKNVVRVWFCNQRQKQKRMKFSTVGLLHQVNGL